VLGILGLTPMESIGVILPRQSNNYHHGEVFETYITVILSILSNKKDHKTWKPFLLESLRVVTIVHFLSS
jgi:hypothetical protein